VISQLYRLHQCMRDLLCYAKLEEYILTSKVWSSMHCWKSYGFHRLRIWPYAPAIWIYQICAVLIWNLLIWMFAAHTPYAPNYQKYEIRILNNLFGLFTNSINASLWPIMIRVDHGVNFSRRLFAWNLCPFSVLQLNLLLMFLSHHLKAEL